MSDEYPKHLFKHPGPYGAGRCSYSVAGACDEAEEATLLERGWHLTKEAAWGVAGGEEGSTRHPLDHDGNGKPGGSTGAKDHMRALRAEYERVVGKKPFSGWDEATLRAKMKEAAGADVNK